MDADPGRKGVADLGRALAARRTGTRPFIVGLTGAVASGKSTLARAVEDEINAWADRPTVETICTDGFLFCNQVLDARGLTLRKGFPETFDAAALAAALVQIQRESVLFPVYSHVIYDVDPALARRIDPPSVLLVEGLGLGAVRPSLDILVFVDAAEADLETWFVARFLELWAAAEADPASFYARFRTLDRDGAAALARSVWREINLPNLRQHVAPLRETADLVVRKGADHQIIAVTPADGAPPGSPPGA